MRGGIAGSATFLVTAYRNRPEHKNVTLEFDHILDVIFDTAHQLNTSQNSCLVSAGKHL